MNVTDNKGRKMRLLDENNGLARYVEQTKPSTRTTLAVCAGLILLALLARLLTGCATTPTALDRALFTTITNYVPQLVLVTNMETRSVTNVTQLTITNVQNQVQVSYLTNVETRSVTNITPVTVTNVVETLAGPSTLTKTIGAGAGTVTNLFAPGMGGLVTAGITGLAAIIMGFRNRQLKGNNSVLSQSAGTLAQIIETAREVLSKTPQGQEAADKLTSWMISHQAATGTIATISQIVKDNVDNGEAKDAADQILELIGENKKS